AGVPGHGVTAPEYGLFLLGNELVLAPEARQRPTSGQTPRLRFGGAEDAEQLVGAGPAEFSGGLDPLRQPAGLAQPGHHPAGPAGPRAPGPRRQSVRGWPERSRPPPWARRASSAPVSPRPDRSGARLDGTAHPIDPSRLVLPPESRPGSSGSSAAASWSL